MIRENRKKQGYSQEELAEKINLSVRQIQRIEENEDKTKIVTLKKLIKILQIPDADIVEFMKK